MTAANGVGPVATVWGGLIAVIGFVGAGQLVTGLQNSPEAQRHGLIARFILRAVPVLKGIGWVGVAVGLVGLVIWAARTT